MPLTMEQKKIILDYLLPEGSFSKGVFEDTPIGLAKEEGTVTEDDVYDYIDEIRERETKFLNENKQ